ncbi:MAG: hypothetical protein WBC91_01250 [Phototrophicaceae bacterium]
MPDLKILAHKAREKQILGESETSIKRYLENQDLNEFQVSAIMSKLAPTKLNTKEDYIVLRYGIKLYRGQIMMAMRVISLIIGVVIILPLLMRLIGISNIESEGGGNPILVWILGIVMILFGTGRLEKWL